MGRIKDTELYALDQYLTLDDYVIGSDTENLGKTQNYGLRGIFDTFRNALNLTSIEYTFSDGTDPDLDQTDAGYFTSNNVLAGAVTSLYVNKMTLSGGNISSLVDVVAQNVSSFVLRLYQPSATGQVFFFVIDTIIDNGTYYTFNVENFVGGNTLVDSTTYGVAFDLAGVPSIVNETDPIFMSSPAAGITAPKIVNWDAAFGWGDHSLVGYLTTETDPVFSVSAASGIIGTQITNWDTAYGWGNHSTVGYLTSETDPTVPSYVKTILASDITNWNFAYGWGNHSLAGYITSETDPVFAASASAGIIGSDITNWNSAYGWGNHALFGYLREINIDTLAELNGIVTDATLIDTTDSRLSDARTPLAHTHVEADITDLQAYLLDAPSNGSEYVRKDGVWAVVSAGGSVSDAVYDATWNGDTTTAPSKNAIYDKIETLGGGGTWGSITGTLSAQTDLQSALDLKLDSSTYTAADVLAKLITVDGAGSGLDADALDGKQGIQYCESGDGLSGDFNDIANVSKITSINASANTPHGSAWYTFYQSRHRGGQSDGSSWASQIAIGMTAYQDRMSFRTESGDVWSGWTDVLTDTATNQTKSGGLAANFLQTNATGDGATLLLFNQERAWAFEQDGTGAGTSLVLRDRAGAKEFRIQDTDGENIFKFRPSSSQFTITGTAGDSILLIEADTDNNDENDSPRIEFKQDGGATTMEMGLIGNSGDQFTSSVGNYAFMNANNGIQYAVGGSLKGRWFSGGLEIESANNLQMKGSAAITRTAHNGGYLEGGYNNIGVSTTNSSPIYAMGSSFAPTLTTLSNMYGIGYTNSAATFLNSTDLGTTPSGWGMYVAADGNARIFLNASNGRGYFKDVIYASNFILNSDRRKKKNIKDVPNTEMNVRWRKFDTKEEWGNDKDRYGVVAQELQITHPEFVNSDDEGNLTVKYIDLLSAKMAEKDKQIEDLMVRMERLELIIKDLL
jgi:hypothetical protein